MNKYFLADESGGSYYFQSFTEVSTFLGVDESIVTSAFFAGSLIQGYAIDELILGGSND